MIFTLEQAVHLRERLHAANQTLVFTNGVFDLLHVGHLDYLEKARAAGDALLVAINDDESTRRYKGEGRPLVPAEERARLLAALRVVDGVLLFADATADRLLAAIRPHIYIKGGDYAHKVLPERPTVAAYGGEVRLIEYLPDHSTTNLIARIKGLPE